MCARSDAALNVFMDVRKMDRKASLASVAGEVEMEEEGDGARLFQSEASWTFFLGQDFWEQGPWNFSSVE